MSNPIQIRRYRPTDVDEIHEAVMESHAELSPWMVWCHDDYSRDDTATWVEGRPDAWKNNQEWGFVIVDENDQFLGTVGIHRLDLLNGVGEAGYWVRTSATGRGVASTALLLLCDWVFAEKNFHRVEILAATDNFGSQKVAQKAGAVREGILRERVHFRGERLDIVLFSILNDDSPS